jgi:hypothetical protein
MVGNSLTRSLLIDNCACYPLAFRLETGESQGLFEFSPAEGCLQPSQRHSINIEFHAREPVDTSELDEIPSFVIEYGPELWMNKADRGNKKDNSSSSAHSSASIADSLLSRLFPPVRIQLQALAVYFCLDSVRIGSSIDFPLQFTRVSNSIEIPLYNLSSRVVSYELYFLSPSIRSGNGPFYVHFQDWTGTIEPQQEKRVQIRFQSSHPCEIRDSLEIRTSSGSYSLPLNGKIIQPKLELSINQMMIGPVPRGFNQKKSFTVKNRSELPIRILSPFSQQENQDKAKQRNSLRKEFSFTRSEEQKIVSEAASPIVSPTALSTRASHLGSPSLSAVASPTASALAKSFSFQFNFPFEGLEFQPNQSLSFDVEFSNHGLIQGKFDFRIPFCCSPLISTEVLGEVLVTATACGDLRLVFSEQNPATNVTAITSSSIASPSSRSSFLLHSNSVALSIDHLDIGYLAQYGWLERELFITNLSSTTLVLGLSPMGVENEYARALTIPNIRIELESPNSPLDSSPFIELNSNETTKLKLKLYGRDVGSFAHRIAFVSTSFVPHKQWEIQLTGNVDAIQLSLGLEERIKREKLPGAKMVEILEEEKENHKEKKFSMYRAGLGVSLSQTRTKQGVEWHLRELTKLRGLQAVAPLSMRQELALPEPYYPLDTLQATRAVPPPLAPAVLSQFRRWYHSRQALQLSSSAQQSGKAEKEAEWARFEAMLK